MIEGDLMKLPCSGRNCGPGLYQGAPGCVRCAVVTHRLSVELRKFGYGATSPSQWPEDFKLPDLKEDK